MSVKFNVPTPTPHYDYTVRLNRSTENIAHQHSIEHVKASQAKWVDYYDAKNKRIDDLHRIERAVERRNELEQVHAYEVLASKHNYAEYKYMFYVGTQFDTYI